MKSYEYPIDWFERVSSCCIISIFGIIIPWSLVIGIIFLILKLLGAI